MRTDVLTERILIIEDDPATGLMLEDLFELVGFEVDRAIDGPQALQLMTRLPAYDLVLLDVMLPQKSGFDVLREARRAGVDSPVIVGSCCRDPFGEGGGLADTPGQGFRRPLFAGSFLSF